jgi:hypothetical protein
LRQAAERPHFPPALFHTLEGIECFRGRGGELLSGQPGSLSLSLSLLQTPSADLFHYDSMNAVNWGMRGEHGLSGLQGRALLGLPRDSGCTVHNCCLTFGKPLLQILSHTGLCPNPKFPLPFISVPLPPFPSSSLILSSPRPWVVSRPSVPYGFPEHHRLPTALFC